MKLTIVVDDRVVGIDGVYRNVDSMPASVANVHAVQWYDSYGEVEYKTQFIGGNIVKPVNEVITSVDSYQWAIDAWAAAEQEG